MSSAVNKVTARHSLSVRPIAAAVASLAARCLLALPGLAFAQAAPAPNPAPATNPAPAISAPGSAPAAKPAAPAAKPGVAIKPVPKVADVVNWAQLSPAQKVALEPLEPRWSKLESPTRQKWLGIAQIFASLKPEDQQRMHEKMRDYVKLSADERRVIRENYSKSKKIDPSQKSAQWEQYQQLPEEQKQKLAAEAAAAAAAKKKVTALPPASKPQAKTVAPVKRPLPPELGCPPGSVKNPATSGPGCVAAPAVTPPAATPPAAPAAVAVPATNAK
ncbi:MAG: DUF3106 domain-containing protein [Massilia sp.]